MIKVILSALLFLPFITQAQIGWEKKLRTHLVDINHNLEWQLKNWFITNPEYELRSFQPITMSLDEYQLGCIEAYYDTDYSLQICSDEKIMDMRIYSTSTEIAYYDSSCDMRFTTLNFYFNSKGEIFPGFHYFLANDCYKVDTVAPNLDIKDYSEYLTKSKSLVNWIVNAWCKNAEQFEFKRIESSQIELSKSHEIMLQKPTFNAEDYKILNGAGIYKIKVRCRTRGKLLVEGNRIKYLIFYLSPNMQIKGVYPSDK